MNGFEIAILVLVSIITLFMINIFAIFMINNYIQKKVKARKNNGISSGSKKNK